MLKNKETFMAWMRAGNTQNAPDMDRLKLFRKDPDAPINFGVPLVQAVEGKFREVDVYINDIIGSWWISEQMITEQVPKTAQTINLYINSPGGDVFQGLAIYDFFERHQATINVRITGIAASMASVIALCGDTIVCPQYAFIMIHNPRSWMVGEADDLEKEAIVLRKIEVGMAQLYASKTNQSFAQVRQWMQDSTYFSGEEAVANGFATATNDDNTVQARAALFDLSLFGASEYQRVAMALPHNTDHNQPTGENDMNEKLRKMLESKGLATDATEDQAWEFLANLDRQQPEVNEDAIRAEAVRVEQERQATIRDITRLANLDDRFAEQLVKENVTVDHARVKVFEAMAKQNPPIGAGRIEIGLTDGEKFRSAASDGMLLRAGIQIAKPAPGATEFKNYEMAAVIRESLRRAGLNITGLHSRRAVADYVFNRREMMHTTSDFPSIFRDVAHKTLLKAYTEAPATWKPWVNTISASDFKTIYGISLSEAPDLDLVNESKEYTYGALTEGQESYRVYKYGKILKLSFEMIVNDDLRAFARIPQLMGNAARRKESDLVYALLVSGNNNHGPTMADGYQLFKTSNHLNLLQTGRSVTAANIDAAAQLMTAQTGLGGSTLDIQPKFLIVGPKNRLAARILMASASSVDDNKNAGVINPMQDELVVIVENRVGAKFTGLGWYLVGDPAQFDTFEVAYLEGYEQPQISEREGFTSDTIEWKIRQFFGVGAMEFRSMVLNDGTA